MVKALKATNNFCIIKNFLSQSHHKVKKIFPSAVFLHQISRMSSTTHGMLSREEVAAMRINYKSQGLKLDELEKKEPFSMFDYWFKVAKDCTLIKEPNAMSLATVSE